MSKPESSKTDQRIRGTASVPPQPTQAQAMAGQRVAIVERMMKLPYIKATRNASVGQEPFVARDDMIMLIHELAKETRARAAAPAVEDAPRVLFQSAVSGLLYEKLEAAGDISAIRVGDRIFHIEQAWEDATPDYKEAVEVIKAWLKRAPHPDCPKELERAEKYVCEGGLSVIEEALRERTVRETEGRK